MNEQQSENYKKLMSEITEKTGIEFDIDGVFVEVFSKGKIEKGQYSNARYIQFSGNQKSHEYKEILLDLSDEKGQVRENSGSIDNLKILISVRDEILEKTGINFGVNTATVNIYDNLGTKLIVIRG